MKNLIAKWIGQRAEKQLGPIHEKVIYNFYGICVMRTNGVWRITP